MRQRLLKAISCFALMVSVFFCTSMIALARPVTDDDFTGSVQVLGSTWIALTNAHEGNLQTGSSSVYGVLSGSSSYCIRLTGLEVGRTYSGFVEVGLTLNSRYGSFPSGVTPFRFSISASPVTVMDDVSLATTGFSDTGTSSTIAWFYLYFNNWYNDVGSTLNYSFSLDVQHIFYSNDGSVPSFEYMEGSTSVDWAGTLYQRLPENGSQLELDAIQQQTDKQQQIANQQAQQSEQQHNSLINGYDNAANDSMLADKNSVLKGFEQQQDQAMSDGQQYVADFSANYDTAPLVAMAPAFMMISTWFNDLWGGMGNFSTVLIVGLMLCVAGYILKLKH